jgi:holliday junction DNA helicase RuvA
MILNMISRVTGKVVELVEKGAVVETSGLGYAIFTPSTFKVGDTTTLHTHLVIRDDVQELYGFETPQEKLLFIKLISVSGVGPKTGLQIMSMYPMNELVRIIKSGDSKAISLVSGVGKKSAEKIIIDLKDKLDGFESSEKGPEHDLVEALISLGYKEYQIRSVVGSINNDLPLQKQITTALQLLGK